MYHETQSPRIVRNYLKLNQRKRLKDSIAEPFNFKLPYFNLNFF